MTTPTDTQTRSIAIGTDMVSSVIQLQNAHPWYTTVGQGSNMAVDNIVPLNELFGRDKTVVVFAVPAPFTGTCTYEHVPGYQKLAPDIHRTGADEIVCVSVTDPYSLYGWQQSMNIVSSNDNNSIRFLADPDATFMCAYGVDRCYKDVSLGLRSERFSMIVRKGIVVHFRYVTEAAKDAQQVLDELTNIMENQDHV